MQPACSVLATAPALLSYLTATVDLTGPLHRLYRLRRDHDLDIDGDVNVAREPQSSDDFVVDTIGSGKVLSPIASQGRARRRVPPTMASESDDDDGGGVLLVDNAFR